MSSCVRVPLASGDTFYLIGDNERHGAAGFHGILCGRKVGKNFVIKHFKWDHVHTAGGPVCRNGNIYVAREGKVGAPGRHWAKVINGSPVSHAVDYGTH